MAVHDPVLRGTERFDGRDYADRLAMIRRMEAAFPEIPEQVESPWGRSPHAGIELQTEWQRDSGRHFPDERGFARGWWAAVNYTLSVWPYRIARKHFSAAGAWPAVRPPEDARYDVDAIAERRWREYLELRFELPRDLVAERRDARDVVRRLQSRLWAAHLRSVRVARDRFRPLLAELPRAERKFARAWGATTVEFLSALNAPTDRRMSGFFNRWLPGFVLRGEAITGPENSLDPSERLMVTRLWELHRREERHDRRLLDAVRAAEPVLARTAFFEHGYGALRQAIRARETDGLAAVLSAFFRELARRAEPA